MDANFWSRWLASLSTQSEDRMETYHDEQGSGANIQSGFGSRLLIVLSVIKGLVSRFKVTQQDLRDAGVYIGRMHD